jgi:hypothetical protein
VVPEIQSHRVLVRRFVTLGNDVLANTTNSEVLHFCKMCLDKRLNYSNLIEFFIIYFSKSPHILTISHCPVSSVNNIKKSYSGQFNRTRNV